MRKCPICELNWIEDDEKCCSVCAQDKMPSKPSVQIRKNGTHQRISWSFQENEIFCEEYVKIFVIGRSTMSASAFVNRIMPLLPKRDFSTLRKKVSNMKQVLADLGVADSLDVSSLYSYSNDHFIAARKVLQKYGYRV